MNAVELQEVEAAENALYEAMNEEFGNIWNAPPPVSLAGFEWHQFRRLAAEKAYHARLAGLGFGPVTDEGLVRMLSERSEGQGYDDATGYRLRCWLALFGLPYKPAWVSRSSITGAA